MNKPGRVANQKGRRKSEFESTELSAWDSRNGGPEIRDSDLEGSVGRIVGMGPLLPEAGWRILILGWNVKARTPRYSRSTITRTSATG
jgi:hypothetical protein